MEKSDLIFGDTLLDLEEAMILINKSKTNMENQYHKLYRSYKASVGWTTKYRNALTEANKKLTEAGLEPVGVTVRVIGGATFASLFEIDEDGQIEIRM